MNHTERSDPLGFENTWFRPSFPKEESAHNKPTIDDSPVEKSLGDLNTVDDGTEVVRSTPFDTGQGQDVLNPGLVLGGNYRLEKRLGRGGMGEAWKADDLIASRNVVIKLVPPEIRNAELAMKQVRNTFRKVHALQHQHICPILSLVEDSNYGICLVMKFIDGKTLDVYRHDYVSRYGRFSIDKAVEILRGIAHALDYSHERNVLHRDVKPQNIMISKADGAQLIDFGLAAEIRSNMMRLSGATMDMAGTRPYMAPEQWEDRQQDAKTDQYALAVTAYELIVGYLPFQNPDCGVLRECILNTEPEWIPGVAESVNRAIRKAMAKRRSDRFETCRDFIESMQGSTVRIKSEKPQKPIEPAKSGAFPGRLRCPVCFYLNDIHARICRCGLPLRIHCPRCGCEGAFGDDSKCKQCDYPIGDMPKAVELVRQAREAIDQNKIDEAGKLILRINSIWRDCPGAEEIRNIVKDRKTRYTQRKKQIRDLETKIRDALEKRYLFEARRLFLDLRKIPDAQSVFVDEERSTVQTLGMVQDKLNRLSSVREIAEKIDLCEDILTLAADCSEARDTLEKFPPLPPDNLSTRIGKSGSVELNWQGPSSRKPATFVIVRKIGAAPVSPDDGDVLSDRLSNTTYVDSRCEVGVVYGYAVFTRRDKAVENIGCRSKLLQRIDDLVNIKILPGNGNLTFSWDQPVNALGIQITRFEGDSVHGGFSQREGTKLLIQRETSFVDTGLVNGKTYVYLFQTVFRGIDGQPVETTGTQVTAKPQWPPPAVVDLRLHDRTAQKRSDGSTWLEWTPPQRGDLFLYVANVKPAVPVGQVEFVDPPGLEKRFGEPIPLLDSRQGRTCWRNPSTGLRSILPITVLDGLAVYGKPLVVVQVPDVENPHARLSGQKLFLAWDWPEYLEKVLITYRSDRFPEGMNDPSAASRVFSKKEYDVEKAFVLAADDTQDFFFRVHGTIDGTLDDTDDADLNDDMHHGVRTAMAQPFYSNGIEIRTTQTTIRWQLVVRREHRFWGKIVAAEIKMVVEEGPDGFPDMILKTDFGRPPLNRNYGTLFLEIPACKERLRTVFVDPDRLEGDEFMRIFVKDASLAEQYALCGPTQEILRSQMKPKTFGEFFREFFCHPLRFIKHMRG